MANLSVALAAARAYLNDESQQTWTDANLLTKAQEAHREMQEELWMCNSPVVRGQSVRQTIAIGGITLTTPITDIVNPTAIFEASVGGTDWVPMTETFYLPLGTTPAPTLIYWSWRGEQINFNPSSANRDVIVQYRRLIPVPASAGDPIGIIFGESYIAARVAALASGAVANIDAYNALTAVAKENLGRVIAANRGQQKSPSRP